MSDEEQDHERAHRDRARSEEAHWQVAEAAAQEEDDRLSEIARQSGAQQKEWENEGGALRHDRQRTQPPSEPRPKSTRDTTEKP